MFNQACLQQIIEVCHPKQDLEGDSQRKLTKCIVFKHFTNTVLLVMRMLQMREIGNHFVKTFVEKLNIRNLNTRFKVIYSD